MCIAQKLHGFDYELVVNHSLSSITWHHALSKIQQNIHLVYLKLTACIVIIATKSKGNILVQLIYMHFSVE